MFNYTCIINPIKITPNLSYRMPIKNCIFRAFSHFLLMLLEIIFFQHCQFAKLSLGDKGNTFQLLLMCLIFTTLYYVWNSSEKLPIHQNMSTQGQCHCAMIKLSRATPTSLIRAHMSFRCSVLVQLPAHVPRNHMNSGTNIWDPATLIESQSWVPGFNPPIIFYIQRFNSGIRSVDWRL